MVSRGPWNADEVGLPAIVGARVCRKQRGMSVLVSPTRVLCEARRSIVLPGGHRGCVYLLSIEVAQAGEHDDAPALAGRAIVISGVCIRRDFDGALRR